MNTTCESLHKPNQSFWLNFFWCWPIFLILPFVVNFFWAVPSLSVRNLQIAWLTSFVLYALFTRKNISLKIRWKEFLELKLPKRFYHIFWYAAAISLSSSPVTKYLKGSISGVDFSIFDQMIYNTHQGRFMYSDLCQCSHFGIHPSLIMFLFVPFHWFFRSPFLLLSMYGLIIVLSAFIVTKLARRWISQESILVLFAGMMLTNSFTGAILNQDFHVEVFYLLFSPLLIYGVVSENKKLFVAGVIGLLTVKEDAALYIVALSLHQIFFTKSWRSLHAVVIFSTLSVLVFELRVVQPWALGLYPNSNGVASQPGYLQRFWGHFGTTHQEIILSMLRQPIKVFYDVLTSSWYKLFGYFLFIPLFSGPIFSAVIPLLLIYGTSSGDPFMRDYSLYYSAPILTFLYFGFLFGLEKLKTRKLLPQGVSIPALQTFVFLFFMLNDQGYMRAFKPNWEFREKFAALNRELLISKQKICIDEKYFPYLDYRIDALPSYMPCPTNRKFVDF